MTPSRKATWALTWGLVAALSGSGCALLGKGEPLAPRYFDPVRLDLPGGERPSSVGPGAPELRLGHVVGASHLRELIAYHVSDLEIGYYEQRRWTERPEDFLRRALSHALFEERGLSNVTGGIAPVLEVELTDFSELLAPTHAVRVRARVVLVDARAVRMERTFSVEQAVTKGEDFALVPEALSVALESCVGQIADAVKSQLLTTVAVQPSAPVSAPAR